MVSIIISGGAPTKVTWFTGMNAQQALEESYPGIHFGVTYYGSYGYMVVMLNGTYDSPISNMYWQFILNGSPASSGIDSTILKDGDIIAFENTIFLSKTHKGSLLEIKHQEAQKKY